MKIEKSFWDVIVSTDNRELVRQTLVLMVPDDIKQEVVNSYNREAQIWLDMKKAKNNVPPDQKCMRELVDKKIKPELCAEATTDYNGHGFWVCDHCNEMLNEEFEREYA